MKALRIGMDAIDGIVAHLTQEAMFVETWVWTPIVLLGRVSLRF